MATRQNTNPELNKGTAAEIGGNIAESVVGGITVGVGEIGRVTGRALGEGVGGCVDGIVDGSRAIYEAFAGPRDPAEYKEWMAERQERIAAKLEVKSAKANMKAMAPLTTAMAQMKAMAEFSEQFAGPPARDTFTASQVQDIVDQAVAKALKGKK